MKKLITILFTVALGLNLNAQTPYNPDSNGDNYLNIIDLLDFLPFYDQSFFSLDSIVTQTITPTYVDTCLPNLVYVHGAQDPHNISLSDSAYFNNDSLCQSIVETGFTIQVGKNFSSQEMVQMAGTIKMRSSSEGAI